MVYQEVGCSEPCLEKRSTRREVNNTDKKERKISGEEDSVGSQKSRRSEGKKEEKELKKVDDRSALVTESNNSDSC